MRKTVLVAGVALAMLTSCVATVLVPGAESVRYMTKGTGAELAQCKVIGPVQEAVNRDSQFCREECQMDLRNRTFALGGDTVLFTGRGSGMAYKCGTTAEKGTK